MKLVKHHLILERNRIADSFDLPLLFLGDWCIQGLASDYLERIDYEISKPYGLGKETKDANNFLSRNIEKDLFEKITPILNEYLHVDYSIREWQIVLGKWIRRYIEVIINRYQTLVQCFTNYQIASVDTLDYSAYELASKDSLEFIWSVGNSEWNAVLESKILDLINISSAQKKVSKPIYNYFSTSHSVKSRSILLKLRHFLRDNYNRISKWLTKNQDYLFLNTYLPKKLEILLNLSLGQIPLIRKTETVEISHQVNREVRVRLTSLLKKDTDSELTSLIYELFFDVIPSCYLEEFSNIRNSIQRRGLPENPKVIFTSNNFDTDEFFKIYAVEKRRLGAKYIVGQHGNNYGTYRYMDYTPEEITCDRFLTWGWHGNLVTHFPTFIFKRTADKKNISSKDGQILLIQVSLFHRMETWDVYAEFKKYFNDQLDFVKTLKSEIRERLLIRLHSEHVHHPWNEVQKWKNFDPNLKIDDGRTDFRKLIQSSRIVIYSYDSTGILECLSNDIPMLAFWQNGFDHLKDSAIPFYKSMVDIGIFHLSHESLSNHLLEHWDDFEDWWMSDDVRRVRRSFADRFARLDSDPIRTLKNAFLKE